MSILNEKINETLSPDFLYIFTKKSLLNLFQKDITIDAFHLQFNDVFELLLDSNN